MLASSDALAAGGLVSDAIFRQGVLSWIGGARRERRLDERDAAWRALCADLSARADDLARLHECLRRDALAIAAERDEAVAWATELEARLETTATSEAGLLDELLRAGEEIRRLKAALAEAEEAAARSKRTGPGTAALPAVR